MLKEILKREVIYTGVMSEQEWDKYEEKILISFTSSSIYTENLRKDLFLRGIENFTNIREEIGKTISLETALEKTMGVGNVEMMEELEKIEKEKKEPKFRNFYSDSQDDF